MNPTSYSRQEIFQLYRPIDYDILRNWGDGSLILADLTSLAQEIYFSLLPYQDKREDRGHVDTVIYYTLRLADLMHLSSSEKEAVVIAAIAHDCGWDLMPDIAVVWNQLVTMLHGDDPEAKALAQAEIYQLRLRHQERGAARIRALLPDHPYIDQIEAVVNDHDTRRNDAPPIFRAFLDGDWMWRVSKTSRLTGSSGSYNRSDAALVYGRLKAEITPEDFLLPWAYFIARLELAVTMIAVQKDFLWPCLPEQFLQEYQEELDVIGR